MIGVIRSETLRVVSALTFLAVLVLMLMIPAIVLTSQGDLDDLPGLGASGATARVFEAVAWAFVTAAFAGAYTVTREYYYHSIERTVVAAGFTRLFWGKLAAGACVGLGLGALVCAVWLGVTEAILRSDGLTVVIDTALWRTVAGALVGSVLGGAAGAALGWIVQNYYLGAALTLGVPVGLEYALTNAAPEVARFSPGMALASLAGPMHRGEVLSVAAGAGVAVLWTGALVGTAYVLARRRFR